MPLESALKIDASVFDPALVSDETKAYNASILKIGEQGPQWWEVGPAKSRQMRLDGQTVLPKPTILPHGISLSIPSRDANRSIPCRLFYPSAQQPSAADPKPRTKGIVMHIHGGGWVLMSQQTSDPLLQLYADESGCVALSVGYRLAPEEPFPAGPRDCEDVAEWIVRNGEEEFGGGLAFIGGESAGGHLSLLTTFHLLRTHPTFTLPGGLLLHFPATDLSHLPTAYSLPNAPVLPLESIRRFVSAFLPSSSGISAKDPRVSPLYEDLEQYRVAGGSRLPRALFTCGTADTLLDDSVFMAAKWQVAGGEAVLRIYPGAVHGFLGFKPAEYEQAGRVLRDTCVFVGEGVERLGEGKGEGGGEREEL